MRSTPSRLPLLIAVSLLTAGIAVVSTPTGLASSPEEPSRAEEPPGPRNLTLSGQVVDLETGEPLADVELDVSNLWISADGHRKAHQAFDVATNATGHYEVAISQGEVRLRIDEPGYQVARAEFPIEANRTLDVPLKPADANRTTIRGVVTGEDGGPLNGSYVRVEAAPQGCEERAPCKERTAHRAEDERESREVETGQGNVTVVYEPRTDRHVSDVIDEEGRFAVQVPAGDYAVEARADGHLEERVEVRGPSGGTGWANVTLTAIPDASVSLTGTVVSTDGEPVPYARVNVDNQRWGTHASESTDEDGHFSLDVRPGYATVRIHAGEHLPCEPVEKSEGGDGAATSRPRPACRGDATREQAYLPRTLTIQPDAGDTVELEPELAPTPEPTATVEGWVVNASSGEAVPNASLVFENEHTNEWGRATTGPNGSYAIDVREGYYTVRVSGDGYFRNATNLRIDAEETRRVTLNLTPGEGVEDRYRLARGHAGGSTDEAVEGGDAASGSSGSAAFEGRPGGLGAYPGAETSANGDARPAPALGVVGAALALAGAGGFVHLRRAG